MNIIHIHPALKSGGIESIICSLSNEMVKNHDVTICTIFRPSDSDIYEKKLDPRIVRINMGKEKTGFSLKELFDIYKLLRKSKYDVVHVHGFFYYYMIPVLLLHRKIKFIYTVHSDAFMENVSWDRLFFRLKRYCFKKRYINPVTISLPSKESFRNLYSLDSTLIYNGVPKPKIDPSEDRLSIYKKTEKTKIFLHPGRITQAKNQIVLCNVFKRLVDEGRDIVLVIAGSKQDDMIFSQMQPFFGERIIYLGERGDVPQLLYNSDAMCLPSIWEGLPVTVLEAFSVGCIPICSPVGGIVDIVKPGYNGILSNGPSESEYYEAINDYLNLSKADIENMKESCVASFDRFDITNVAAHYIDKYMLN